MITFNPGDANLLINILRLLHDAIKAYRTRTGEEHPGKREQVLSEAVEEAAKMSAQGADNNTVVSKIQTKLEEGLGAGGRDEILRRASSIMALAEPFEMESFEYFTNLSVVLSKARDFCISANIFRLRGATNGQIALLPLPQLSRKLREVCSDYAVITDRLLTGDVFKVRIIEAPAFLSTSVAGLHITLSLGLINSDHVGGSYVRAANAELLLAKGTEVNKIGFDVKSDYYLPAFEVRLSGREFKELISAIFDDLTAYATELADEQHEFRNDVQPALSEILSRWPQSGR